MYTDRRTDILNINVKALSIFDFIVSSIRKKKKNFIKMNHFFLIANTLS